MEMNKDKIIKELLEKTRKSNEECDIILDILGKHKIIGRKNKNLLKTEFMNELKITEKEADKIYNICMELILKDFFKK